MGPAAWAYESVLGSGLLGMGQEPISALTRIPAVKQVFEPAQTSARSVFGRPVSQGFGVGESYMFTLDRFIGTLHNPDQATNYLRRLLPFQNHFLLARAFTFAEEETGKALEDWFDLDGGGGGHSF